MARKRKFGNCAYCGRLAKLTADHVPPQSMFPAGTDLITVPACRDCNGGASGDDEYFAAAVALRIEVSENPVVNALLPKVMRGISRAGRRGHTGSIVTSMKPVELRSPSGLYLGRTGVFVPDDARMSRTIGRIVRGLFYHEFKTRLPDTHGVGVNVIGMLEPSDGNAEKWERGIKGLLEFGLAGKRIVVHPGVFYYSVNMVKDKDHDPLTVWVMQFYGHTPTVCTTTRRDHWPGKRPLF